MSVLNGLVLVSTIRRKIDDEGLSVEAAIAETRLLRLRPILMTALTTICGLIPMALGSSSFIGIPYAPLGRTVISGLTVATLLTLVLIPFLYAWLDDIAGGARRWAGYVMRGPVADEEGRA